MDRHLISIIEDQVIVEFSGRINVLDAKTRQLYGTIILRDGDVIKADYKNQTALKAFFSIYLDDLKNNEIIFVVEPEVVDNVSKNIHYPWKTLIQKMSESMHEYEKCKALKPPKDVKILPRPEFLDSGDQINEEEFKLLSLISDYNKVEDIYEKSNLLEYEITMALVSLRKKGALKVIKQASTV